MALVWTVAGCTSRTGSDDSRLPSEDAGSMVPINFDGNNADQLLRFYFGSFLGPEGGDPVEAGILEKREKTWYLRSPHSVDGIPASLQQLYETASRAGELSEDALEAFIQSTYYEARDFPATLEEMLERDGFWSEPEWFRIDVQGSMVSLRRTTWIRRSDIEKALDRMEKLDDPVMYDPATLIVGEHLEGSRTVETTLMKKRQDGFWDYWAYDEDGRLTDVVRKDPRDMLVPTRCTGCHYGDRLFEPERSFPALARPGPNGERALYIPEQWRNADLSSTMQEHARRSDTVLGLYATLFLAEAVAHARSGTGSPSPYLERFGIDSSP